MKGKAPKEEQKCRHLMIKVETLKFTLINLENSFFIKHPKLEITESLSHLRNALWEISN